MAGDGVSHRRDDLLQGPIVGNQFQDHLSILFQALRLASDEFGFFGCGALSFGLSHHILLLGNIDHCTGCALGWLFTHLKMPLAAHPADGAARQHQPEFVLGHFGSCP